MRDEGLQSYYARRAREYDRIYDKPERAADLARLRGMVQGLVAGRDVLEIACGTGYWTAVMAGSARSVLATDAVEEVLAVAKGRSLPAESVRFALASAFDLRRVAGAFDTGVAAFWWSHVPRERLASFRDGWHERLGTGARVVLIDNLYVPGSSTTIAAADAAGNTYQDRRLEDGTTVRVLKNFPFEGEVASVLAGRAADLVEVRLTYYWVAHYTIGKAIAE